MASWIKLLVIMRVDKIDAKKGKQFFFIKPQVLTCIFLFFEIYRRSLHHKPSKRYTQNQNLKWIQRNIKKAIVILQRVNFCFQNT